jgi:putative N6-adenine-specific DNA methylase
VLWRVGEFSYRNESDLHGGGAQGGLDALLHGGAHAAGQRLSAEEPADQPDFATLRIKDAVCDRFRETLGSRPNVRPRNPDVRGARPSSKRRAAPLLPRHLPARRSSSAGWRTLPGEGAAARRTSRGIVILLLGLAARASRLLDPMCGGGTPAAEPRQWRAAARRARRGFGFREIEDFRSDCGERSNETNPKPPNSANLRQRHDPRVLGDARRNIAAAAWTAG